MTTSFECPSCGAELVPPTTPAVSVTCQYCGTTVAVPQELRLQPPPPPPPPQPEGVTVNIRPPEEDRPQITINMSPDELAQLEKVEAAMQAPRRARRGFLGCGGCGCFSLLLLLAAFAGFLIFVFGFSIKGSVLYQCAVQKAQTNAAVINLIGTPIKADTFAWIRGYESSGSREAGHFTTQLTGPKGNGTLAVDGTRSSRNTDLDITFESGGKTIRVNSGPAKCE
jgi:hypothetical protein